MPTKRHQRELNEIKAMTSGLVERFDDIDRELERIAEMQQRQLATGARQGLRAEPDEAPVDPLIAFVHIPKTAGGTATNMLASAYSRRAIHDAGNCLTSSEKTAKKLTRRAGGWERWQRRGGRVTAGHVPYGLFRQHLPNDTRYITFLREPVDRVLSHYHRHVRTGTARDQQKLERGRVLAGSLREALVELRLPELSNLATRLLCGHPSPMGELPASALDDARANLREFEFVGIQDRFPESIALLQRTLDLDRIPYRNRHVSIDRPAMEEITDAERALIAEHNRLDAELYAFAQKLFEGAVAAADPGAAAERMGVSNAAIKRPVLSAPGCSRDGS